MHGVKAYRVESKHRALTLRRANHWPVLRGTSRGRERESGQREQFDRLSVEQQKQTMTKLQEIEPRIEQSNWFQSLLEFVGVDTERDSVRGRVNTRPDTGSQGDRHSDNGSEYDDGYSIDLLTDAENTNDEDGKS